jgi:hypothetical protein
MVRKFHHLHVVVRVICVAAIAAFVRQPKFIAGGDLAFGKPLQHLRDKDIPVVFGSGIATSWLVIYIGVFVMAHINNRLGNDLVSVHLAIPPINPRCDVFWSPREQAVCMLAGALEVTAVAV